MIGRRSTRRASASPMRRAAAGIVAASALLIGAGAALTATRAVAVFQDIAETGRPGYLVLAVDSSTALWTTLAPGGTARWLVQASLHDTSTGELSIELEIRDPLPGAAGLTAEIEACTGGFDFGGAQPSCDGELEVVMQETAIASFAPSSGRFELASLEQDAPRQLLVTLSLPPNASPLPASEQPLARIGLGVHVDGETPDRTPQPETDIPVTGSDLLPLGLLATGLIGLGCGIALHRRKAGTGRSNI